MKSELRKKLQPYFEQIDDAKAELNRIFLAQRDCIKRKGFNGCWNCDVAEDECAVTQTREMVNKKVELLRLHIVYKVEDWLKDD